MAGRIGQSATTLIRRVRSDRRGATAIVFALGATVFLGLVGLATEGGTWYLEKRHGQNAADAAAISGALALASQQSGSAAVNTATAIATSNGYTAGTVNGTTTTVTINYGTYSGGSFTPNTGPNAVRAIVTRSSPRLFSSLFLQNNPNIGEAAVATVNLLGNPCILSFGQLIIGGDFSSTKGCTIGTNDTNSDAVWFKGVKGAGAVQANVVSAGGCTGSCDASKYLYTYQPTATDPFSSQITSNAVSFPTSFTGNKCDATPTAYTSTQHAFCGSTWSPATASLPPGTYVFYTTAISIGNSSFTCSGCTFVLIDKSNGNGNGTKATISIGGSATVTLSAPTDTTYPPGLTGLVIYKPSGSPVNGTNASVSITGGANVTVSGGIYLPTSDVTVQGNMLGTSASGCTEIVAQQVTLTGSATLDLSGCPATTNTTAFQDVKLVN